MLNRLAHAFAAAFTAFRFTLTAHPASGSRPGWDTGVNYDVPTFLRRGISPSL